MILTLGEEKLSFGNTAPYSATAALICASSSGNANFFCPPSLSLSSSEFSSSERVLSAGLGNAGGMLNEMRAPSQCVND